jgi:cysteine desulfurase
VVNDGRVYLDHAATTPMRAVAIDATLAVLRSTYGNPSGIHHEARAAKRALEEAREEIAELLGAAPGEVVLTGGGTEGDNLAVKGAARAAREAGRGNGVVTTAFEHKGVLASCARLAGDGFDAREVRIDTRGIVDLDALADALDDTTVVVSLMLVNNELGTVQPLEVVAALVRERAPRAVLHTDAVQAVPWLDVAAATVDADLVAISAHKFGGPKGVGALVVRGGVALEPSIEGGGQERGLRSGTNDVAGVVAMAVALRATAGERDTEVARVGALRDRLVDGLLATVPGAFENGDRAHKVAGNVHLGFPGVEAEALLVALDQDGVCAAAGSSCSSGATEPSHVLVALGLDVAAARSSVRLSLGYASSDHDVDVALRVIPDAVARLRGHGGAGA